MGAAAQQLHPPKGHSTLRAHSDPSDTFVFLVHVRRGLEQLLCHDLANFPGIQSPDVIASSVREGVVELTGRWNALYTVVYGSRLAESVWVRVGEPFEVGSMADLAKGVRDAPWLNFVPCDLMCSLPLSVQVHESRLDAEGAALVVDGVLRELAGAKRATVRRDPVSPYQLCVRVLVKESACSLELSCSGRLNVRPFVYAPNYSLTNSTEPKPIPTPYRGHALANQTSRGFNAWSLRPASLSPTLAPRDADAQSDVIAREWHGTRDLAATHAATVVKQLPLQKLLADERGLLVWDPFCGSGSLLLEVLATALDLTTAAPAHPWPCSKLLPHSEEVALSTISSTLIKEQRQPTGIEKLTLVGSDRSSAAILRARRLLHRFCTYYQTFLPQVDSITSASDEIGQRSVATLDSGLRRRGLRQRSRPREKVVQTMRTTHNADSPRRQGSVLSEETPLKTADERQQPSVTEEELKSFSSTTDKSWGISLPCEFSLNVTPFEHVAPFLSGALLLTRVPNEVHALGPTARVAHLYRRFGQMVASRTDWCGVYVLTDSCIFRRQSRLAWEEQHGSRTIRAAGIWFCGGWALGVVAEVVPRHSSHYAMRVSHSLVVFVADVVGKARHVDGPWVVGATVQLGSGRSMGMRDESAEDNFSVAVVPA
eukprot:CAMPEP_0172835144 /NCGR_PEP_ID=MMETSP1075-20121228/25531_1 /TAXON_ID=2916 /ORGANISM="Ceratium fusus, Strain PA161109" /LENGTH=654 /DNA_ID=CAMNT_0013678147 /DNA_START=108 /DNA_END=2069 /DNA_ORIENTATION=+